MPVKLKPFVRLRFFCEGSGGIFATPSVMGTGCFSLIRIGFRPYSEWWKENHFYFPRIDFDNEF